MTKPRCEHTPSPPTLAGLVSDRLLGLLDKESRLLKADFAALVRAVAIGLLLWAVSIALIGTGLHLLAGLLAALLVTEAGFNPAFAAFLVSALGIAGGVWLARHAWKSIAAQAAALRTLRSLKQDAETIKEVFQ